ncbi:MAG: hypothetical protein KGZ30_02755 [Anaplasmataceae bacterium]|nr:hypothetical protein [Anaplasmataceae bacterium]
MKAFLLLLTFLTGSVISLTTTVYAAECEFSGPIEELATIQSKPTTREQVLRELTLRKTILNELTSCLVKETQDKEKSLKATTLASPETKAYARWLENQFVETVSFYEFKKTQINDLGIEGSKDLAKEMLDRRRTNDRILFERTNLFITWNQNQELFTLGYKRLNDITATLEVFDLPPNHELGKLLIDAKTALEKANKLNLEAWESLKSSNQEGTLPLIKSSLETLAESYKVFFTISEESKKELPL